MEFDYKLDNFVGVPNEDKRIIIYDKIGSFKYSINPVNISHTYVKNNCLIIKIFNKNDISLTFESLEIARLALIKLDDTRKMFEEIWYEGTSGIDGTSGTSGTSGIDTLLFFSGIYYLDTIDSDVTNYKVLSKSGPDSVTTPIETVIIDTMGETLVTSYITDYLGTTLIPAGKWEFHVFCKVDNTTGLSIYTVKLYKRDVDDNETFIFSGSTTDINVTTTIDDKIIKYFSYDINMNMTDRLVLKVYASTSSVTNKTLTYYTEGNLYSSYVETPVTSYLTTTT
jgi:hypothetical protein